ncbi:prephenate dehydrogenase [Pseudoclavibacter chungangensis]|uniref:Prephenate dehydrogenase n=1 Tax=Pseudoclavibacter chungangensis TaxID=587635 RepID=A0A7J5BNM9_9MICO|nr:prephenate dehydrogenase [Pseudoclavibacter chungangensis]KAB1653274.1 prephenate dehydrogenase [Pseudoclavibacter chungangensis]NYJ66961.1 prephenate dehydrogenase [Pseudoclavibacter chungangensis]
MTPTRTVSPVRVVGTGLLGTSVGLGLRRLGVDVLLSDASPSALRLAVDYGAGRAAPAESADAADAADTPVLVVVCVPPDVTARVVAQELAAWPSAIVTDVASVKSGPLDELRAAGVELSRYLGSHPMAGRETGGPLSGRADLFLGRPWVIAQHEGVTVHALQEIEGLALDLGATPIVMTAQEHDASVALVSHVPQIVSSVLASQLLGDDLGATALAGQGLRDVTRVASSDPTLWVQILAANGARVASILRDVARDIDEVAGALEEVDAAGSRRVVAEHLSRGNDGVARIPGKHGKQRDFANLIVMVDDRPGQLARLMTDIGDAAVNIEDFRVEHAQGAEVGLVELAVLPEVRGRLEDGLTALGWRVVE